MMTEPINRVIFQPETASYSDVDGMVLEAQHMLELEESKLASEIGMSQDAVPTDLSGPMSCQ